MPKPTGEELRRLKLVAGDAWSKVSVAARGLAYDYVCLLEARTEIDLRESLGESDTPRLARLRRSVDAYEGTMKLYRCRLARSVADTERAMLRWIDAEED